MFKAFNATNRPESLAQTAVFVFDYNHEQHGFNSTSLTFLSKIAINRQTCDGRGNLTNRIQSNDCQCEVREISIIDNVKYENIQPNILVLSD